MPRDANRNPQPRARTICFVTGTRAEFGLMRTTLRAIAAHRALRLQLIATGMHLSRRHGRSVEQIRADGFTLDGTVPWPAADTSPVATAAATGAAIAHLARTYQRLSPDLVLVVGDRVEAFAAASAAHIAGIPVAHVHGGDRALGQVDDALRHAITKLSHVHFPATKQSADRILKLGEDRWRIRRVGSPGIDGITRDAAPWSAVARDLPLLQPRRFILVALHPASPDEAVEERRARTLVRSVFDAGPFAGIVFVYPNNDPGSSGIARAWDQLRGLHQVPDYCNSVAFHRNLPRPLFLTYLKHATAVVGNSSAGIIEAASFGTPVVNVGPRQIGRERNANVIDVTYARAAISSALRNIWNGGNPRRYSAQNLYGSGRTSEKIARTLATLPLDDRLRRKLIAY